MTRRSGLTMTELLVAIFVVAIGLAGVMSMVPFGAKQMSDALVADRAASHAHTTDGMMRSIWREKVIDDTSGNGSGEPFWTALVNPGNGLPLLGPTDPAASYPVFIDPIGYGRSGGVNDNKNWVGDNGKADTAIPRRTLNDFPNADNAIRAWSQPDGFSWDEAQDSAVPVNGAAMREYRYNSLAVVQRPANNQQNTATLKIVVFSNRRPRFFPTGSEAVIPQAANVIFTPGSTAVQVPISQIPASSEIRKGGWIMDGTVNSTFRHANFYRVVSALDNGSTNAGVAVLDIELHTPIKRIDGGTSSYPATIVLFPGVAGVFERSLLTPNR
ncbi:prepilin-type N-terminal cleavage/methylation domain-containing protein [Gemmata sp. JC717]|uniref:type IV pilus modification PilV family protein n=1 Tax=Gemmata algarum TaxID=2975278 RepID=UPI0021BB110B|nr:prepilin-type N-terminal cleavage/methylation domain-containing protein [Gemmata algarum]MDY3552348.1 prepilin-type N-terminal cleavage/methylation domain-containing protein [Gemmata algarum]